MIELRDAEVEQERFRLRLIVAMLTVLVAFSLLVSRLVYLQVLSFDELTTRAENNRIAVVPVVPNRGLIVDRNGIVLANNYSAYTLEITRSQLSEDLETVIDQLATIVDIQPRDRKRLRRLMGDSKSFESLPIRNRLTDEEVARFMAQRYRFPGVDIKARLFRNYPYGEIGGHVLGYIGRINQSEKKLMDDWTEEDFANYRGTDVIGKLGVEQRYERELHGITGVEEVETSAAGRPVRRLRSEPATPGHTVRLSIDIRLQGLIEDMFGERRGALVAIDPRNGEVLAFVSKPSFDPNLFVDGIDQDSWKELNESINKPLLNRALRGTYPPGSTYKPFMAMAALNTGKRTAGQITYDSGTFVFGDHRFRSHGDAGLGAVDMARSIVQSSNVYYYALANDMGVDLIHDQMDPFGFGRRTGIDLDGEATGDLPSTSWKRKKYKRAAQQRWYAGETISLGIGQGYNNFTMLQVASAMATLVSGGQRYEPRVVRDVENVVTHERQRIAGEALPPLAFKPEHVEVIRRAMYGVTQTGTSTKVFAGAPYQSGGKTGTAQARSLGANEKYNASRISEYLRDHSLYTAFAPLDEPRVALAVIVENAGFGAEAAAPIARRVLDYVLLGQYPSEQDLALVRTGQVGAPIGVPRRASDIMPTLIHSAGFSAAAPASDAASGTAPGASAAAASPAASAPAPVAASGSAGAGRGLVQPAWVRARPATAPAARPSASEPTR
ncbi:peptidoglycan glycosyltransferase /cell elongation-specific peptidoglycan D,D-transpeptidase [Sphaerotilus hippei]|uniref:Peptidoglycan D,D-transpeptidase MrdA n=1 Tax=Sphaerotilus hippei TaxID=744406 RepID=A0A318H5W0_9BURK|nr:penicillin-binding protein 2 [Sphaerotilus hippei]PXW96910.1 peptidoglycan glycosyltransferase /cell elongation-specific peptidoglycan D,D-transpeptidase [Sphaerotilus hippei]